jgi:hypothetical protein
MNSSLVLMAGVLLRNLGPGECVCLALLGIWGIFLQLFDGEIRLRGRGVWDRAEQPRKFWTMIALEVTCVLCVLIMLALTLRR